MVRYSEQLICIFKLSHICLCVRFNLNLLFYYYTDTNKLLKIIIELEKLVQNNQKAFDKNFTQKSPRNGFD